MCLSQEFQGRKSLLKNLVPDITDVFGALDVFLLSDRDEFWVVH